MRKTWLLLLFVAITLNANAQIISTIAGNGTPGDTGDGGLAIAASLNEPFACAFDSHGNFYVTEVEGVVVRKINTSGIISTFAGGGSSLGDGGPATAAQFSDPTGIAVDASDNVYIMDHTGNRVRRIDAITGIITTIAGNGTAGYGGDNGPATASVIEANNICIDGLGNLYIPDGLNNRIRKINTSGIISTFAGNGINGYYGDGGQATAAEISLLIGICADVDNNIYFSQGANIRKISTTGIITTIAGNGSIGNYGYGGPATAAAVTPFDLATDRFGNLYISCSDTNIISKIDAHGIIYAIAGNGTAAFGGDGGQATAAELNMPVGLALDTCGNLFIADQFDNHVRKVAINPSCINLSVGNVKSETAISVYPNPAYDVLNIDNLQTEASYYLQNIEGSTVQAGMLKAGNNSISVQSLPPAVYMLEVVDEEGERVVRKIIKE